MTQVEFLDYGCFEGGKNASAPGVELSNPVFHLSTVGKVLRFALRERITTFESAEERINDFVRSFEAERLLQSGIRRREYRLTSGRMVGGSSAAFMRGAMYIIGDDAIARYKSRKRWKTLFEESPIAFALARRYEDYLAGKEALAVVGYFVVTATD